MVPLFAGSPSLFFYVSPLVLCLLDEYSHFSASGVSLITQIDITVVAEELSAQYSVALWLAVETCTVVALDSVFLTLYTLFDTHTGLWFSPSFRSYGAAIPVASSVIVRSRDSATMIGLFVLREEGSPCCDYTLSSWTYGTTNPTVEFRFCNLSFYPTPIALASRLYSAIPSALWWFRSLPLNYLLRLIVRHYIKGVGVCWNWSSIRVDEQIFDWSTMIQRSCSPTVLLSFPLLSLWWVSDPPLFMCSSLCRVIMGLIPRLRHRAARLTNSAENQSASKSVDVQPFSDRIRNLTLWMAIGYKEKCGTTYTHHM